MSSAHADRNLLFGILALQMDFIGRDALVAAMNAWVLDKTKSLGQILLDQGALRPDTHAVLEALVQKHLELHDGDAAKSLAAVSSLGSARQALQEVADADVQASLAIVSRDRRADDPDATREHVSARSPGRAEPSWAGLPTSAGLRFRVLRPHARGGLGEVYVAHDEELHREVALKEIQARHADDPHSRARFLLEAEVTGGLEHPGVVPVYGLGQYADGRPFYAMRFIRGDSLMDAIRRFHDAERPGRDAGEGRLAFRELLGRFVDVCQAVTYAHSRGVLHRDLKPGNVMLGQYGETLVVDWGLAKVVGRGEHADDKPTLRPSSASGVAGTAYGAAVGTPAYMSPEQAAGRLDELGPASDVYGLGATLYALLTGRPPVEGKDPGEVLRRAERGEVVPVRQANPRAPAALAAVCQKALALHPEGRYATPLELAAEVEHWLADEPVAAYREPVGERLARWGRRHRAVVSGAAAVLVTAVAGLGAGLLAVRAEQRQTAEQRDAAQGQRARAEQSEQAAKDEAANARRSAAEARAALQYVEDRVFAAARPARQGGGLGRQVSLREAVEWSLPYVAESFRDQPLIEARLRLTLGTSFRYLGDPRTAAAQEEKARALYTKHYGPDHPDTLRSLSNLANSCDDLGRHADAFKLRQEVLALQEARLGPDHPDTLRSRMGIATSYSILGRDAEALRLRQETLALQKAKLGPDHPDTLLSLTNLATGYAAGRGPPAPPGGAWPVESQARAQPPAHAVQHVGRCGQLAATRAQRRGRAAPR
jgi:eukaryotic-like serine/threonine-protein kinase